MITGFGFSGFGTSDPEGNLAAAGAAQTPNIDAVRPAQKPCIKNPSVLLLVVLRFFVDPEIVRDGRVSSFPALGGRFGGSPGPPNLIFVLYSRPNVSRTVSGHP